MSEDLVFNGIDGATGDYLLPPLPAQVISRLARGETIRAGELNELRARHHAATAHFLGVVEGVDARSLAEAGWGVVFAHDADPAVAEALHPLLEHRREQAAGRNEHRYREYAGEDGCHPEEDHLEFLVRNGVAPGMPANPERMPYSLLLVGDPKSIPFSLQYGLDVTRAVGRIHFDSPEEYASYARGVVEAERRGPVPRRAGFFGVENPDDRPTRLSAEHLVAPLAARIAGEFAEWSFETVIGEEATKPRLGGVLADAPSFLFSASHGMGFNPRGTPSRSRTRDGPVP